MSEKYNKHNREDVLRRAKELEGTSLRMWSEKFVSTKKNKGSFGTMLEEVYELGVNTRSVPDFETLHIELKATPLKETLAGKLVSKERLVIMMINYMKVVNETFETSHFKEKAQEMLVHFYLYKPEQEILDYTIKMVELIKLDGLPSQDYEQIKQDWETVVKKIKRGEAHLLSGSDTLYLEAATKAASSASRKQQPFSDIPAKPRAWAFKNSYMTALATQYMEKREAIPRTKEEQNYSLLKLIKKRFKPYFGLRENDLFEKFGYCVNEKKKPKNAAALITKKILGISTDAQIDEFAKGGIVVKTMHLKKNGIPKESVSFPAFNYFDVAEKPFEQSRLYEDLQHPFLFVIYKADKKDEACLFDVVLWQMPDEDVEEAKRCYEEMQKRIIEGRANESVKSSENRCCHVRPHGRNSYDVLPVPGGGYEVKKGFWLTNKYVGSQIQKEIN